MGSLEVSHDLLYLVFTGGLASLLLLLGHKVDKGLRLVVHDIFKLL
jgi:hypothetical protein